MSPIAVRMNNPGNLIAGPTWQGLMPDCDMTAEQRDETKFAVFCNPVWGFRALAILLINYQKIDGLKTIASIIHRYAPPEENNTEAYIRDVCAHMGMVRDDVLDLSITYNLRNLAKAIAVHEAGGWFFTDGDLNVGVQMAADRYHSEDSA